MDSNSIIIKDKINFQSVEVESALEIYRSNFEKSEFARPTDKVRYMLKNSSNYHLLVASYRKIIIGISIVYLFYDLKIGFLDYLVVSEPYRGLGVGKKLFRYTLHKINKEINHCTAMIIEIQKEDTKHNGSKEFNKDRIHFYSKMGVKFLKNFRYFLPPLSYIPTKEMYLALYPFNDFHTISKFSLFKYVYKIYSDIYNYDNKEIIQNMFACFPSTFELYEKLL
jgi:GNAT superfamily N-acetyltransferase